MHVRRLLNLAAPVAAGMMLISPLAGQAPAAPPQITLTGVSYLQYGYQLKDTANHNNSFDVTRAYLNVLGKFSGGVGTRITTDVQRVGAGDNSLRIRLKYAFVTYNRSGGPLTWKLGLFQTPWIDWEEALWDYRMQGPVLLDRNGYLTSSSFGFGADGNINKEQVDFQAGIFDNGSYSSGPGDQRKFVEGRVSVRAMDTDDASRVGGLRLTGFAQVGKPVTGGTATRFIGMVSYRSKQFTLAGLGGVTADSVAVSTAKVKGQVLGAFGVFHLTNSPVSVIARVDYVKPNKNALSTAPGFTNTRFIGGLSYQLTTNVRLLADVDLLSYKNGSPTAAAEATREQALFQAQFTF